MVDQHVLREVTGEYEAATPAASDSSPFTFTQPGDRLLGYLFAGKISRSAYIMAITLATYASHNGDEVYPLISTLVERTGWSRRCVFECIEQLRDQRILTIVGNRRHGGSTYILHYIRQSRTPIPEVTIVATKKRRQVRQSAPHVQQVRQSAPHQTGANPRTPTGANPRTPTPETGAPICTLQVRQSAPRTIRREPDVDEVNQTHMEPYTKRRADASLGAVDMSILDDDQVIAEDGLESGGCDTTTPSTLPTQQDPGPTPILIPLSEHPGNPDVVPAGCAPHTLGGNIWQGMPDDMTIGDLIEWKSKRARAVMLDLEARYFPPSGHLRKDGTPTETRQKHQMALLCELWNDFIKGGNPRTDRLGGIVRIQAKGDWVSVAAAIPLMAGRPTRGDPMAYLSGVVKGLKGDADGGTNSTGRRANANHGSGGIQGGMVSRQAYTSDDIAEQGSRLGFGG